MLTVIKKMAVYQMPLYETNFFYASGKCKQTCSKSFTNNETLSTFLHALQLEQNFRRLQFQLICVRLILS